MRAEWVGDLYAYNRWANERILDTAALVSDADFRTDPAGHGSMRDVLYHTMFGHRLWLSRWRRRPAASFPAADAFPDVETLSSRWRSIEDETAAFVATLADADLAADVTFTSTSGLPFSHPLWVLLLTQVTHATQHRSEVALALTDLGHSPGDLDFVVYRTIAGAGR